MSEHDDPSTPDADAASTTPDADAASTARKPASAAAAAASRARRIGGRTPVTRAGATAGTPAASDTAETAPTTQAATASVQPAVPDDTASPTTTSLDKPTKPAKPAKLGKLAKTAGAGASAASTTASKPATSEKAARTGAGAPGPSRLVLWAPAAVLTVAALVFAVLVAVSTHGEQWGRSSGGAERDRVLAAAKSCVVATNSYDYKALTTFRTKALACATGPFATQLKKTITDVLEKDAPTVKQIQSLQVNSGGILSVSDDNQWNLLIYGQLSVTNAATTTPRIDPFASVVRVQQIAGKWRINAVCTAQFAGPIDSCYS